VTISEADGTDDLSADRASDDEAAFVGIVGGLVAGLVTYAALKRVANAVFGPEKTGRYHKR
jgi:hypothetical protein